MAQDVPEDLVSRLRAIGAEALVAHARLSLRLIPGRGEVPIGGSHLGGFCDVPPGFQWPARFGTPLAPLLQLDLREVHRVSPGAVLPSEGWLLFFYDCAEQPWGFDPKDRERFAVRWVQGRRRSLQRMMPGGVDAQGLLKPVPLALKERWELPHPEDDLTEAAGLGDLSYEAQDAYEELYNELIGYEEDAEVTDHHLLGHPLIEQNPMRDECQLVANGLDAGRPEAYRTPEALELLAAPHLDWSLLLQLDSDRDGEPDPEDPYGDPGEFMWGDLGRLYWWIRDEDLAAQRFDRVWCILQCG